MECLLPFSLDWCKAATTPLKLRAELQEERTELLHCMLWYM